MVHQLLQSNQWAMLTLMFLLVFVVEVSAQSTTTTTNKNNNNYVRYTNTTTKGSNKPLSISNNKTTTMWFKKTNTTATNGNQQQQQQKQVQKNNSSGPLIVGGTPTKPGEFPSYVTSAAEFTCGATLIYPDIVLSAAHCESETFAAGVYVGGGLFYQDPTSGYEYFDVVRSVSHPEYYVDEVNGNYYNDVMIIKLSRPSTAPLQELNFDETVPVDDEIVTAIGHGTTSSGGELSSRLLKVSLPIVSIDDCIAAYGDGIQPEIHLCAGANGKDTCQGDSGGPLYSTSTTMNVQVGITSFGIGCGNPGIPGVYARVSAYKDFIQQQICNLSANPPDYCVQDVTIRVEDYFFAFNAYGVDNPSKNDYEDLTSAFNKYFLNVVQNEYSNLKSVRSTVDFTAYENPDYPRTGGDYNIYIEYKHADYKFESSSNNDVPSSSEIMNAMSNAINRKFIVNVVRRVGGPFHDVTDVLFGEVHAKERTYQTAHADKN